MASSIASPKVGDPRFVTINARIYNAAGVDQGADGALQVVSLGASLLAISPNNATVVNGWYALPLSGSQMEPGQRFTINCTVSNLGTNANFSVGISGGGNGPVYGVSSVAVANNAVVPITVSGTYGGPNARPWLIITDLGGGARPSLINAVVFRPDELPLVT